jgi:licheninase
MHASRRSAAVRCAVALGTVSLMVAPPAPFLAGAQPGGRCGATAASALGWGAPDRADEFDGAPAGWSIYDGPGHHGNGRRTPSAITVSNGVLTITGDAQGNSGGMSWYPGLRYGRWEVCAMTPPSADTYHAVLLLWPDSNNWRTGGEIDFMEDTEGRRQNPEGFLHYGTEQDSASINIDATQWHSWAVEWTSRQVTFFVDGREWWRSSDPDHVPSGAMHLCMQLDNFGGDTSAGGQLSVDWARQYRL